ncbi:hypothetical protein LTS18_002041, partial [Coniosporium uncinatum]
MTLKEKSGKVADTVVQVEARGELARGDIGVDGLAGGDYELSFSCSAAGGQGPQGHPAGYGGKGKGWSQGRNGYKNWFKAGTHGKSWGEGGHGGHGGYGGHGGPGG